MGAGTSDDGVAGDESVLRLTWRPAEFDSAGQLLPEAFRTKDFEGPGSGVSVDRECCCSETAIRSRAERQRPNKPDDRKSAFLSRSIVRDIRDPVDVPVSNNEGEQVQGGAPPMFDVIADPLEENAAHSLISSRRKRKPSERREARLKLIALFSEHIELDDYFADTKG